MTRVLYPTKLSKHFQRAQKNEITQTRPVITSNCLTKNKLLQSFNAKQVNIFVSNYQVERPVFKKDLLTKEVTY